MEKLTWFKFVISDWIMGKIMKCPEITQARFLRLCCLYWNKECILSYEDAEIEIDSEHLIILLSKKVIQKEDDLISIKFLNEQNDSVSSLSGKRSEAAKIRWERIRILQEIALQDDANAQQNNAFALQNDAEKSREEKSRNIVVDKTPSHNFYKIEELEQTKLEGSEFLLLAHRQSKRPHQEIINFFPHFIRDKKAEGTVFWKNQADARQHFISWLKKQPSQTAQTLYPYGQAAN